MRNSIYTYIAAISLVLCGLVGFSLGQDIVGDTSISYDDSTGTVTAYGETVNNLDTDYTTDAWMSVYDQDNTLVAYGAVTNQFDTASYSLQFTATPGSTYTAGTNHCVRLQSWDYAETYPYHLFYYDNWYMSTFLGQNIESIWDYDFASPGYTIIHRTSNVVCLGKTYDTVEAAPTITIKKGDQVVASNAKNAIVVTPTVSVGERIDLTTTVSRGTQTNPQWTIDGSIVQNYSVVCTGSPGQNAGTILCDSPTSAVAPTPSPQELQQTYQQSPLSYYWVDGADNRSVVFSVTVNSHPYQVTAKFNVKQPTITNLDYPNNLVGIHAHFGVEHFEYGLPPTNAGVTFTATTNENGMNNGAYQWVQTYNQSKSTRLLAATTNPVCAAGHSLVYSGQGLDTTYPYIFGKTMNDSPGITLEAGWDLVTVSDSATAWLMFNPDPNVSTNIWVPLKKVDWSWGGSVERIANDPNNDWEPVPNTTYSNPTPTVTSTTSFPMWTQNIKPTPTGVCQ